MILLLSSELVATALLFSDVGAIVLRDVASIIATIAHIATCSFPAWLANEFRAVGSTISKPLPIPNNVLSGRPVLRSSVDIVAVSIMSLQFLAAFTVAVSCLSYACP